MTTRRNYIKSILIGLFAAICFVGSIFSFGLLSKRTSVAEAAEAKATFEMVGSSVRTAASDGIRFIAQVDGETLASYGDARYGMIIVPKDMADEGDLTVAYADGVYTPSDADALVIEGGEMWSEELREKNGIEDGYEAFSCALIADQGDGSTPVRFPQEFYNRELTAVAFIIPEDGETVYTGKLTRSLSYVALVESLRPEYEANELIENIVASIEAELTVNEGNPLAYPDRDYAPTLTIGGIDANASDLVRVDYASDDEAVIKVVDGKLQAVANGTATVRAIVTVEGGKTYTTSAQVVVEFAQVQISVSSNPTAGGSVTGGGTYTYGETVTLTATPNAGYEFDGWYIWPNRISKETTIEVVAEQNIHYTAVWDEAAYELEIEKNIQEAGSVTGDEYLYKYGTEVTVTATTEASWCTFDGWYLNGQKVSSETSYTLTMLGDTVIEARWNYKKYVLSGIADPAEGGTITGFGPYEYKSYGTLTATPNIGYRFDGWYDGTFEMTTNNSYTVQVLGNKSYTAKFTQLKQKVSISTDHMYAGNISGGGNYAYGETVTLKSSANAGYSFEGWYENGVKISSEPEYTFTMGLEERSFYAKWLIHISFDLNGGESQTPATQIIPKNGKVTQPANPTRTGYTFSHWSASSPKETPFDFSAEIAFSGTLYANWTINTYTVSFNVNGGSGSVASQTVNYNSTATAPSTNPTRTGYTFQGWGTSSSATSTVDVTTIAITAAKTYYAVWKINTYTVTVSKGTGISSVSGGGTYDYGTSVTINATVSTGYTWKNWTGSATTTTKEYTFTLGAGNVSYTANATINSYTVTFNANGGSGGSTQTVNYNAKPTTPTSPTRTGYTFQGWGTSSSATSTVDVTTVAIKATTTYYAVWKINTYTVTFNSKGGSSVTAKTTNYNTAITAPTAPTKTGYTFKHWSKTDGGSTAYDFSTKVTSNFTLYAVWTPINYTITVKAYNEGGTVSGGGSKAYDSSVTVKATTNSGYTFLGWYDVNDKNVCTTLSYTFVVKGAATLTAKWKAGSLSADEATWKATNGYNYFYYTQLGTDVMPIGAWSSPPPAATVTVAGVKKEFPTNQITLANYQTLKESGINAIYGLYDSVWSNDNSTTQRANVAKALDCAEQTGMVYVVRDGNAYTALSSKGNSAWSQFEFYMNHPAYGGTLFVDEPGYDQFDEIGAAMKLWNANELYGDNKLALVNNLPIYSSAPQLYYGIATQNTTAPTDYTGANFEAWVRAYLDMTQARVYSYDFYPYTLYGNRYMADPNGYGFFDNISVVRKVCMEKNVPFWTFNQSGAAFKGTRFLTYAETAMQVNLSLAYGAKGIQWFNYWQPLESGAGDDELCALIDHNGNKTRYYDMVQKVNKQAAKAGKYLMKSKSTGIIELGSSILGAVPAADKVTKYGALTSATGSGNAIIGCFDYRNNGNVYYISSTDFTEDAVVTLNFNGTYEMTKIQDGLESFIHSNTATVHVPAGEGVLIYVPKSTSAMSTARTITLEQAMLDGSSATGGYVYGAGNYQNGKTTVVAAVPKLGYKFVGWWEGTSVVSTNPVMAFTPSANRTLKAYFRVDNSTTMLNDCEVMEGSLTNHDGGLFMTRSTDHVTQGTYSAKGSGTVRIKLGDHPMTLAELKSTYTAIGFHLYLDSSAYTVLMLGNWVGPNVELKSGSNFVVIKTANLTADHYEILWGAGYLTISTNPGTANIYIDNVVGLRSTAMLNDCDTYGVTNSGAGLGTLSNAYVAEGNYAQQLTLPAYTWLNLRVMDGELTLSELQATYSTITFNVHSSYNGLALFFGTDTAASADRYRILYSGWNTVTINTSELDSTSYVVSPYGGAWLVFTTGGADATLYIDNVVGTLK